MTNPRFLHYTEEELDELDDKAIMTLLQSSDADSSSEDDVTPMSSKPRLQSSPGDVSVWKAVINIVNYIEGIGFLALPYTLRKGGIAAIIAADQIFYRSCVNLQHFRSRSLAYFITTIIALMITPVILWYTGKILIECLYDQKEQRKIRTRSTIKGLGDVISPKFGGYLVYGCIQCDVFLLSASYLTLCGSLMSYALPSVPITELQWTCIAGALVLPTTFLKSLSQIAWLSAVSVFALVVAAVTVVWYGAEHTQEWNLGPILFWDAEGVLIATAIILYSYASLPILPYVEESMAEKVKFSRALGLAHLINFLMKLLFSLFGFLSFGINTNEAILNNLPPGPVHITVSSVFVFSCLLSYVLALYPVIDSFDSLTRRFQNDKIPSFLMYTAVRVSLVLSAVTVAILVPHFALIISFLGSLNAPFVLYVFPCVVHLKLRFQQLETYQICIGLCLIVFGVLAAVLGIIFSSKALVHAVSN